MSARSPGKQLQIDIQAECIWRDGEKVSVPPKAFLLLRSLMERAGQLVTKGDLLAAIWPNTFVTETVLTNAVNQLRQALGDDPKQPRFIETVHRRGYRWVAPLPSQGVVEDRNMGARDVPSPDPLGPGAGSPPSLIVGREAALAELERAFARATDGARQMVFVTGEPGIGKTSLIDEFIRRGLGVEGLGVTGRTSPTP